MTANLLAVLVALILCPTFHTFSLVMSGKGFGERRFAYTGALRPGIQSPTRVVPSGIACPPYVNTRKKLEDTFDEDAPVKATPAEDISKMRTSCRLAREVLDCAVRAVHAGQVSTTDDIDRVVHDETLKRNAYPSPLHYHGFPKSCCTSLNEIVCHGIPDSTKLKSGDVLNIDVTVYHEGVHGDCSETICIGKIASTKLKQLIRTTYDALNHAIDLCRPGVPYSSIGSAVEDTIKPFGYSPVRECAGHGINKEFHTSPTILHFKNDFSNAVMAVGHTFTIEPIVCLGESKIVQWPDGWTLATKDGGPCAQFEHTLLIVEGGVEVLTKKLSDSPPFFWEQK